MKQVYILHNQDGYFLGKEGLGKGALKSKNTKDDSHVMWVDGREPAALYRTEYKDEAVNMQFEVNTLDVNLRLHIQQVSCNLQNLPVIPEENLPPPLLAVAEEPDNTEDGILAQDMITEADSHQLATGELSV